MPTYTSADKPSFLSETVWFMEVRNGRWVADCRACSGVNDVDPYNCARHEDTAKHRDSTFQLQRRAKETEERRQHSRPSLVPINGTNDWLATALMRSLQTPTSRAPLPPPPISSAFPHEPLGDPPPLFDWYDIDHLSDADLRLESTPDSLSNLTDMILDVWENGPDVIGSEDEEDENPEHEEGSSRSSDEDEPEESGFIRLAPKRSKTTVEDDGWFPWGDRVTCTLDIAMHLPRSTFSQKQHDLLNWLLRANGVQEPPSPKSLKAVNEKLQRLYGVQTYKYKGAFGNVYYCNSVADYISGDMCDPQVRPHLWFYPEHAGSRLSETRQATRWLEEIDDGELTPMIRVGQSSSFEDFYIFEPALIRQGWVVMPHRWFVREGRLVGRCWRMREFRRSGGDNSWRVMKNESVEVEESEFLASFPVLHERWREYGITDVSKVEDVCQTNGTVAPWSQTDPIKGNPWRERAKGAKCLFYPMWLYCDDTSGNMSKKWNAHNSFLFTAAGLPRTHVSLERNIHFLSTSNVSPPVEMLEGIADQICDGQENGVWAWDCLEHAPVLMIPCVLAMLGDNPMQSEFACHIGLGGKFFCRVCNVKGKDVAPDPKPRKKKKGKKGKGNAKDTNASHTTSSLVGNDSDGADSVASIESVESIETQDGASEVVKVNLKKKRKPESMQEMLTRALDFIKPGRLRTRSESLDILETHMQNAHTLDSMMRCDNIRKRSGVKDKFQMFFVQKLQDSYAKRKGLAAKREALDEAISKLPQSTTSPIWRVRGLNPHSDTPVEVLHVVLLGFVKYLWRDVIQNQLHKDDEHKAELSARLSSVGLDGLGLDTAALAGDTLVNYAGSLTGADFRKISQIAPFVLHGMVAKDCYETWIVLSKLIPLIWQPEIVDIESYLATLEKEIHSFLLHAAKWSINWFNKPKFHILVHLPDHIRRFGPAMLFATEAFESYNAIIRQKSVHSNRQAPSRDIAFGFAQGDRIRNAVGGGTFLMRDAVLWTEEDEDARRKFNDPLLPQSERVTDVQLYFRRHIPHRDHWVTAGKHCLMLVNEPDSKRTIGHYLGLVDVQKIREAKYLSCQFKSGEGQAKFQTTLTGQRFPDLGAFSRESGYCRRASRLTLQNGDRCNLQSFVVVCLTDGVVSIARVHEILQLQVPIESSHSTTVLVQLMDVGPEASDYGMPPITAKSPDEYKALEPEDILCTVNTQHNCIRNACVVKKTAAIRQERETTALRKGRIEHAGSPDDRVLNTAQMRSAKVVQQFRIPNKALPADLTIFESTKREIDVRKAKAAAEKAEVEGKKGESEGKEGANSEEDRGQETHDLTRAREGRRKDTEKGKQGGKTRSTRTRGTNKTPPTILPSSTTLTDALYPFDGFDANTHRQVEHSQRSLPHSLPTPHVPSPLAHPALQPSSWESFFVPPMLNTPIHGIPSSLYDGGHTYPAQSAAHFATEGGVSSSLPIDHSRPRPRPRPLHASSGSCGRPAPYQELYGYREPLFNPWAQALAHVPSPHAISDQYPSSQRHTPAPNIVNIGFSSSAPPPNTSFPPYRSSHGSRPQVPTRLRDSGWPHGERAEGSGE